VVTEIVSRQFFDGEELHGVTRLVIEDGVVLHWEPTQRTEDFFLISPGLVDVQMNGFGANDVAVANTATLLALDDELARHGTTSWCATFVTAPLDRMSGIIEKLHSIWDENVVPGFLGVHVEGPFLGHVPGAHRPEWIIPIDMDWLESLPASVAIITMGAEQEFIVPAVQLLLSKGIVTSLGHSRPTDEQSTAALNAGASMVTHLFNGMSGIHHRDDGLALSALLDSRVRLGLIADMVHVSPQAVALAFAAAGDRRVCLVSDSIAWQSTWAASRGIERREGAPRLPDDTLAGSSTPLSECVSAVVHRSGVPLLQALRAATSTPADLLGRRDVGRLTIGQPADFVAFDDSLHVVNTWRRLPSTRA
jgi:N-acetylglucosamine-6-phosphate deacetylase